MAAFIRVGAGFALALLAAVPSAAEDTRPTAETVVATVNGTAITLGHVIVAAEALPDQYRQLPDDVLFEGVLDQLIQQTVLEQSVTASPRDALTVANDRRGYFANVALQAVARAAVTEAAIEAAYKATYVDAPPATEYNARHILVETEEKAKEIKAELDAGGDFAALAKANSADPGSAANGGDLGWFGLGMMVKPFEDAVVALAPGAVSAPVQTQFGWHLVELVETRPAPVPTIDEVREDLAQTIQREALEAHVADLTAKATVTRTTEGIDPATLRDLTLVGE
jgi:peptidyl-prolyl cis-trans isomerase C